MLWLVDIDLALWRNGVKTRLQYIEWREERQAILKKTMQSLSKNLEFCSFGKTHDRDLRKEVAWSHLCLEKIPCFELKGAGAMNGSLREGWIQREFTEPSLH